MRAKPNYGSVVTDFVRAPCDIFNKRMNPVIRTKAAVLRRQTSRKLTTKASIFDANKSATVPTQLDLRQRSWFKRFFQFLNDCSFEEGTLKTANRRRCNELETQFFELCGCFPAVVADVNLFKTYLRLERQDCSNTLSKTEFIREMLMEMLEFMEVASTFTYEHIVPWRDVTVISSQ